MILNPSAFFDECGWLNGRKTILFGSLSCSPWIRSCCGTISNCLVQLRLRLAVAVDFIKMSPAWRIHGNKVKKIKGLSFLFGAAPLNRDVNIAALTNARFSWSRGAMFPTKCNWKHNKDGLICWSLPHFFSLLAVPSRIGVLIGNMNGLCHFFFQSIVSDFQFVSIMHATLVMLLWHWVYSLTSGVHTNQHSTKIMLGSVNTF